MTAHQFSSTQIRQISEAATFDHHWPLITKTISDAASIGAHETKYSFPVRLEYWHRLRDALKNHGFHVQPDRPILGRWGKVRGLLIRWP